MPDRVYLYTEREMADIEAFPLRCCVSKMLSSWKEIAHFFGKGVRTVQRWEKTLDLPIHRPPGAPSNVVLARTSDLEEWMHRGPVARAVGEEMTVQPASTIVLSAVSALESEIVDLASWAGLQVPRPEEASSAEDRITAVTMVVNQVRVMLSSSREARAA